MNNLSILQTINETMHLGRLIKATDEKVMNGFFANYLAALVLLRLQDINGLLLINDPTHAKLSKFSNQMSDVNFWGRALFYPTAPEVKERLAFGHAEVLSKASGRVLDARIQKLMKIPLTDPSKVDWDDTVGSLLLLKHRFSLSSSYFNNILYAIHKWDGASDSEKKRTVNQAFMYLMQSDPQSALIGRLRTLSNSSMIKGISSLAQKIINFKRLHEDSEGGGDGGTVAVSTSSFASTDGGVSQSSNAIINGRMNNVTVDDTKTDIQSVLANLYKLKKKAPNQVTNKTKIAFKDGKIVKKRSKAFQVKRFKAPDFMKAAKQKQEKANAK